MYTSHLEWGYSSKCAPPLHTINDTAIIRADRCVKSTEKHGDACLTLRVFPTTLFCHHNHAALTSTSENVHANTGAQTKQQAIRVQQRDGSSWKRYEIGWFDDTINRDYVCSISEGALGVIWVSEIGWPGVGVLGIWNLGIWSPGARSGELADTSRSRTPGAYCSCSLDSGSWGVVESNFVKYLEGRRFKPVVSSL